MASGWYYLSILTDDGGFVWVVHDYPDNVDIMSFPSATDMFVYKHDQFEILRDGNGILKNRKAKRAPRKILRGNMVDPDGGIHALATDRCPELNKHMDSIADMDARIRDALRESLGL